MKYNYIKRDYECDRKSMVFVHGFTQNGDIFNKQIEYFKDSYEIILIDLQNYEKSLDQNEAPGIERYTDDLQEVFWNLSLRKVIFWGTHTGTTIGMNLYLRNPNLFSCLILEAPVITQYTSSTLNVEHNKPFVRLDQAICSWMNSEWYNYMKGNPFLARYHECKTIIESFNSSFNKSASTSKKGPKTWPELAKFNLPILAYNGAKDMEDFHKMTNDLKKCMSVSTEIIPEASGFPVCENADYVNKLVSKYIENIVI